MKNVKFTTTFAIISIVSMIRVTCAPDSATADDGVLCAVAVVPVAVADGAAVVAVVAHVATTAVVATADDGVLCAVAAVPIAVVAAAAVVAVVAHVATTAVVATAGAGAGAVQRGGVVAVERAGQPR